MSASPSAPSLLQSARVWSWQVFWGVLAASVVHDLVLGVWATLKRAIAA